MKNIITAIVIFLLSACNSIFEPYFTPSINPEFKLTNTPFDFGKHWHKDGYTPESIRKFGSENCKHGMIIQGLDGTPTPETVQMLAKVKSCMLANGFKPLEP